MSAVLAEAAARAEDGFDWRNPDYLPIWKARADRLARLRDDPELMQGVKAYYRTHLDDFINDWGVTVDPRVAAKGRPAIMPLILWPKQRAFVRWLHERVDRQRDGVTVKSRDVGISWLAMGFSAGMCIFNNDVSIGFGSEKEDKVDRSGDPDCLFYKGKMFLTYLPEEFRGGWNLKQYSAHMRLIFPATASSITGEAGNNIGRGGRKLMYFVDESAHIPNPKAIDASLIANTEIRVDMSSVWGMANSFAERAHNGDIDRFDFHFKDDPRKDEEWERHKRATTDPAVFAQEYDCNFTASIEGQVIPSEYVTAAVDAHVRLGLTPSGKRCGTLDVADAGRDANAFCAGQLWLVEEVQSWKGSADLDIFHSVEKAFLLSDLHGIDTFYYDADGLGAGVRGDARKVNDTRDRKLFVEAFRGSGAVFDPEGTSPGTDRTNEDFFENLKAQAWWMLRHRFQYTHRLMKRLDAGESVESVLRDFNPSSFISIKRNFPERARLCIELSQPVWAMSKHGKVMVDKCPVGTKTEVRNSIASPNLADSVMMFFAPRFGPIVIDPTLLAATAGVRR